MRRTPNAGSRSKSKPKNYLQQNKPSLANLMNHYNADESYNVKLNMNHRNPQIIQTNSYQLNNQREQSRSTWKQKDPFKDLVLINDTLHQDRRGAARCSQNDSKRFPQRTPKRENLHNLFDQSSYLGSNQTNKDMSREGYGLFRQIIKKQSRQNSITTNCEYYDMIQKKAIEIKQEKKKMLQRCHSNGTLSNMIDTMKANTNNQIDQYARRILTDTDNVLGNQSKMEEKTESKVSEKVGSPVNNDSGFNAHFSFQIDLFQTETSNGNVLNENQAKQNSLFDYFGKENSSIKESQKSTEQENTQRPFSQISHSKENNPKGNIPQITNPIFSHHYSPKVETPAHRFLNPQLATVFTQIQLKPKEPKPDPRYTTPNNPLSLVQLVPIVRKKSVNTKDKWIKIQRPENLEYLQEIMKQQPLKPPNPDSRKPNNFNH